MAKKRPDHAKHEPYDVPIGNEAPEESGVTSAHLWRAVRRSDADLTPYGTIPRDGIPGVDHFFWDCSSGCRWYMRLEGKQGMDWGVCANLSSHRCGQLTWEHMGCVYYEREQNADD